MSLFFIFHPIVNSTGISFESVLQSPSITSWWKREYSF